MVIQPPSIVTISLTSLGINIISSGVFFMDYTNSEIRQLIEEHVHRRRDRNLLIDRLVDGVRYEPLAEKYGLSTVQVKRIVTREKRRLFENLK